jgi:hypothetical protein
MRVGFICYIRLIVALVLPAVLSRQAHRAKPETLRSGVIQEYRIDTACFSGGTAKSSFFGDQFQAGIDGGRV